MADQNDLYVGVSFTVAGPGERLGHCRFCGEPMFIEASGVSHHLTPGDLIDHDADADHVAVLEEEP